MIGAAAWSKWRRRWFGRVEVDDPRPIAEAAPYTFYLPSENELLALQPGDLVKISVRSLPQGTKWDAERMWFEVREARGDELTGALDNYPSDMPQLRPGSKLRFQRSAVIDVDWAADRMPPPPPSPARRWYWERCLVDRCVLDDGVPVYYLYREEPDLGEEGDIYSDSGWRIRGDYRNISDVEFDRRESEYIAVGKVLNADDSWLHLIDAPIGSAFIRDEETAVLVAAD